MTPDTLLAALQDTDMMLPLLFSLIAGALIGVEREYHGKPAGVRTHTLVCFASALMTLVGARMAEWVLNMPSDAQIVSDLARMPHAILTGIGFLGAGVIFREGPTVQGLTTAASLWFTAALGIVFGVGMLELGAIGTVAALAVLLVLRVLQYFTPPKPVVRIEVGVRQDSWYDSALLVSSLAARGLQPGAVSVRQDRASGMRRYMLMAAAPGVDVNCEDLARELQHDDEVQELSVIPLENEAEEADS